MCSYPGCIELIPIGVGYCPKHQRSLAQYNAQRQAHYDRTVRVRDAEVYAMYRSPEWLRLRTYIQDKYKGLCVWSYANGVLIPADEVHHIIPVREAWALRFDPDNLIPLIHRVHMQVEAAYKRGPAEKKKMQEALRWALAAWPAGGGEGKKV